MTIFKRNKLNSLLCDWPDGLVHTSGWLSAHGYSPALVKHYCQSGWLKKLANGAYVKLNDVPTWSGSIHALQAEHRLSVHIGGLSALEFSGLAHYIPLSNRGGIQLYNTTDKKRSLPRWFQITYPHMKYKQYHLFESELGLEEKEFDHLRVNVSSVERAFLEVLALVPHDFEFFHAYQLSENLRLIRPEVIQGLLEQCTSIKVKRLFLYFAQKHQLPCFSYLKVNRIELGSGKRVIGDGGLYIPEYQLSIPHVTIDGEEIPDV